MRSRKARSCDTIDSAPEPTTKSLEPVEPREVEIVRLLVEQEHVETWEEDRGQAHARGLAARERYLSRGRTGPAIPRSAHTPPIRAFEVGASPSASHRSSAAEYRSLSPPFCPAPWPAHPSLRARACLGIGHPGAARWEQRPHRLAVASVRLLGGGSRRSRGRPASRCHGSPWCSLWPPGKRSSVVFPLPLVADHAHPGPGADRQGLTPSRITVVGPSEPERVRDERRAHRVSRGGRDARRRADRTTRSLIAHTLLSTRPRGARPRAPCPR